MFTDEDPWDPVSLVKMKRTKGFPFRKKRGVGWIAQEAV